MDEASTHKLQGRLLTMSNKIKIPVARLQEIILEEVSRFYNLEEREELFNEEDDYLTEEEDLEEAIVTGATEAEKQAAVQAVTTALKSASADKAVAAAIGAGVSVPGVKAIR